MKRNILLILLSSFFLIACTQGQVVENVEQAAEEENLETVGENQETLTEEAEILELLDQVISTEMVETGQNIFKIEKQNIANIEGEEANPIYRLEYVDEILNNIPTELPGQPIKLTLHDLLDLEFDFKEVEDFGPDLIMAFPGLNNARIDTYSHLLESPYFFGFNFIVLDKDEFYIFDNGGFEGIPQYKYYNGSNFIDLDEVLKFALADEFKGEYFPQYSATISPSYIRFEEENYCCDILHDMNSEDRNDYRKVFILDRKTNEVIKSQKVPRNRKMPQNLQ